MKYIACKHSIFVHQLQLKTIIKISSVCFILLTSFNDRNWNSNYFSSFNEGIFSLFYHLFMDMVNSMNFQEYSAEISKVDQIQHHTAKISKI
jgi:membrane-bound metal-dependent hydrolase YbcI (DUF457 family)